MFSMRALLLDSRSVLRGRGNKPKGVYRLLGEVGGESSSGESFLLLTALRFLGNLRPLAEKPVGGGYRGRFGFWETSDRWRRRYNVIVWVLPDETPPFGGPGTATKGGKVCFVCLLTGGIAAAAEEGLTLLRRGGWRRGTDDWAEMRPPLR